MLESIDTGAFGQMSLLHPLGRGGMATVYLAELRGDNGFRRRIAVKVIEISRTGAVTEQETWFANEARLGGFLQHDHIAQTLFNGKAEGLLYLAMEYVDGPSLHDVQQFLKRNDALMPPDIALQIFDQLCEGMEAAHLAIDQNGAPLRLVHRDLKPSNLMFTSGGTLKICDFGIARAQSNEDQTQVSGVIKGTVRYMAPEQAYGQKDLDHRCDLFSMAALLYELLSSRPLYIADSIGRQLRLAQDADVASSLDALPLDLPLRAAFQAFFRRALARLPADRYQSAREMQAALDPIYERIPHTLTLRKWLAQYVGLKASRPATSHNIQIQNIELPSSATLDPDGLESRTAITSQPGDSGSTEALKRAIREARERESQRIVSLLEEAPDTRQVEPTRVQEETERSQKKSRTHLPVEPTLPSAALLQAGPIEMPMSIYQEPAAQRPPLQESSASDPASLSAGVEDGRKPTAIAPVVLIGVAIAALVLIGVWGLMGASDNTSSSQDAGGTGMSRPAVTQVPVAPPLTVQATGQTGGDSNPIPEEKVASAPPPSSKTKGQPPPSTTTTKPGPIKPESPVRPEPPKYEVEKAVVASAPPSAQAEVESTSIEGTQAGFLTLSTKGEINGTAFLNDQALGGSFPVQNIPLAPGNHLLRFEPASGEPALTKSLWSVPGRKVRCVANFDKTPPDLICRYGDR